MTSKPFFGGMAALYGLLLALSAFGVPTFFFLPITVFGIEAGKLLTVLICFGLAYYLARK